MKRKITLSQIVFFLYLLILTWFILFKLAISVEEIPHIRDLNLRLFYNSYYKNGNVNWLEMGFNIIGFIPMGMYIALFKPEWNFLQKALLIPAISLAYESIQFIFSLGYTDITDLLTNTTGGVLGIMIFNILEYHMEEKTESIINHLGIAAEVLIVGIYLLWRIVT